MGLITANVCVDAADPIAQTRWWAQVLEDVTVPEEESFEDPDECGLRWPDGRWLLFLKVPEPKRVKNRLHLCLRPGRGASRDAEVERLLALGATMVDDRRQPDSGWAVLADPEGNEFCVLLTPADEAGIG